MYTPSSQLLKLVKISKNKIEIPKLIKIEIPAMSATITPPLGPLLGQYGLNTMEFCKEFNEETKFIEKDTIVPVFLFLFKDKTYYFSLGTPGVAYFIRKVIESNEITKSPTGYYFIKKNVFLKFVYNIALAKLLLLNNKPVPTLFLKNYIYSIIGTARSFGIKIVI